jgi:hypothetical protein
MCQDRGHPGPPKAHDRRANPQHLDQVLRVTAGGPPVRLVVAGAGPLPGGLTLAKDGLGRLT